MLPDSLYLIKKRGETQEVWHAIVLAMATVECGLDQSDRNELQPYLENAWSLVCRNMCKCFEF